jgi:hypothetical protein
VVTGGGYASSADMSVYNSTMSGNGWQVYARNNSVSSKLLNAYAICLAGTSATASQVGSHTMIAGGATGGTEATCPSGSLLTGGGFITSSNMPIYNSSMKLGDSETWMAYARNLSGSSQQLNSQAICLTFP